MKIQTCVAASVLMGAMVFSQGEAYQGAKKQGKEWKQQPLAGKQCAPGQQCAPGEAQWKAQCAQKQGQKAQQCPAKPGQAAGDAMWKQALAKFDWNGDGQLSESEKTAAKLWKEQQCAAK
jgi:hypothetical protein